MVTESPSPPVRPELERWVQAGLISRAQSDAIVQFELDGSPPLRASSATAVAPTTGAAPRDDGEPAVGTRAALVVEVIAYLGAALMVSAVMGIVAREWRDLGLAARVAMVAVPTVVAIVVGAIFKDRSGPLARLASVAWFLGLGGVAWTCVLVLADGFEVAEHTVATTTLAVVATLALCAWWWMREPLQLLALVGTSTGLVAAVMQQAGVTSPPAFGLVVTALGLGWFVQARRPWMGPALAGTVAGLVTAFVGTQVVSADWEVLGPALAAVGALGVMALSIVDRSTLELLLGSLGLFVSLPRLMFTWLGDSLGAPVALLLCGGLLVVVAVRIARTRSPRGGPAGGATNVTRPEFGIGRPTE